MEKIERKFKDGPYRISKYASHVIISEKDGQSLVKVDTGMQEGFVFMPPGEMKKATTSLMSKSFEMYELLEFMMGEGFWGQVKSYHYKGKTLEEYIPHLLQESNRTNNKDK